MRKYGLILAVAFLAALWVGAGLYVFRTFSRSRLQVVVPKGNCPASLAVFDFRSSGDPDSKYYAAGFGRALADRTYCAPKCVTQQMSADEIRGAVRREGKDPRSSISDELAVKLGKKMGTAYVVTGDMKLSGGKASISVYVIDTAHPGSRRVYTASGTLAELPEMQSKLAPLVVSAMRIKSDSAGSAGLRRPNFTKPETLKTYGRSFFSKPEECESLRWKAVEADPHSSFAFARLLDFYKSGPSSCAELRTNRRLARTSGSAEFRDNSQIAVLYGLLLAKESEYEQAESVLQNVVQDDPGIIRGHTALSYVAMLRQNGDLAVREAGKAVEAWPNNAYLHASLANAYSQAASNARHGDYWNHMSASVRRRWKASRMKSLEEALISVKLDRDCCEGWFSVLANSRELSRAKDMQTAYRELVRIDPTNVKAYTSYAFCFSPQWGGRDADQERIFAQAEDAFPRGSYKPLFVKASSLSANYTRGGRVGGPYADEILKMAEEISRKTGDQCEDAIYVKCQAYELTRRRADFLQVSQYAFNKWGGLTWQYRYGMGCAFAYEDKHDLSYLRKAAELFADYSREVPFDPRGYVQYGWCLSHLGRREEAKSQFLKALEIDPGNESARRKLQYVQ